MRQRGGGVARLALAPRWRDQSHSETDCATRADLAGGRKKWGESAVAPGRRKQSFFGALKKERIKRRIYPNREAARSDVFDSIEMFYNPIRRHGSAGDLSPVEFERRYAQSGN